MSAHRCAYYHIARSTLPIHGRYHLDTLLLGVQKSVISSIYTCLYDSPHLDNCNTTALLPITTAAVLNHTGVTV
jgi:hypothetical protein